MIIPINKSIYIEILPKMSEEKQIEYMKEQLRRIINEIPLPPQSLYKKEKYNEITRNSTYNT